jgi:hypothetical protein
MLTHGCWPHGENHYLVALWKRGTIARTRSSLRSGAGRATATLPETPHNGNRRDSIAVVRGRIGGSNMFTTSLWRSIQTCFALSLALSVNAFCETPSKRTLVEYWYSGDDGLSQRLTVAVEAAFKTAHDFTPSFGKKPGTLIVYVPHHVGWEKKFWRTRALYTVEFKSSEGQDLGTESGACWASDMGKCASRILAVRGRRLVGCCDRVGPLRPGRVVQ